VPLSPIRPLIVAFASDASSLGHGAIIVGVIAAAHDFARELRLLHSCNAPLACGGGIAGGGSLNSRLSSLLAGCATPASSGRLPSSLFES